MEAPIPIELHANFQTIDVSEITLNLVNDGDFGSSCPSDFDDNCVVGSFDLLFYRIPLMRRLRCDADLNGDGTVNVAYLLGCWRVMAKRLLQLKSERI